MKRDYDVAIIGAGAAGMTAAIVAARENKSVLLLEKLPQAGAKLRATGGGRCNLTNTLTNEEFMAKFGRNGRFMQNALGLFDRRALTAFLKQIGVETHAPDGLRVFPVSHNAQTVISALLKEIRRTSIKLLTSQKVKNIFKNKKDLYVLETEQELFYAKNVIIATGGMGYPSLGAQGEGYALARDLGHKVTTLYPAMTPLKTKEKWVQKCRADTIAKAELKVALKKHTKIRATGDLIFTKSGLRGPLILDAARELTPLLTKYDEVPILVNLTKGMNEEQIKEHIKNRLAEDPQLNIYELAATLLPSSLAKELCILADIDLKATYGKITGAKKAKLLEMLAWTPLTLTGHDGFKTAMITRGGIELKEIDPKTMQSKIVNGLYFCGEIMDLDGPCGGYNLQWSFSSGYLAGKLL